MLPAAAAGPRVQGRGNGLAGVEGADLVGRVLVQERGRPAVRIGLVGGEAGVGLDRCVVGTAVAVRALGSVAGDGAVHDVGVRGPNRLVAQVEPVDDPGAEVLDDHVCIRGEGHDDLAALVGAEVDGDAALPPVARQVEGAHPLDGNTYPTGDVTDPGALDLDHVGPLIGQQRDRVGAGKSDRQIEHLHPRQRTR